MSHPQKSHSGILVFFEDVADPAMSKVVAATRAEWKTISGSTAPKEIEADFGNGDAGQNGGELEEADTAAQLLTATLYDRPAVKLLASALPDLAYKITII